MSSLELLPSIVVWTCHGKKKYVERKEDKKVKAQKTLFFFKNSDAIKNIATCRIFFHVFPKRKEEFSNVSPPPLFFFHIKC